MNGSNTYTNTTLVSVGALGGIGTIQGPVMVASGATLSPGTAAIGTLTATKTLSLAAGSTTAVKISMDGGANNDMVQGLSNVSYAGTLVVNNVGVSPLVGGTQFHLFSSASPGSGNFANAASVTILPAGTGTFNPLTGILTIAGGSPTVNPPTVTGGNLILTGTGGTPGGSYSWLSSTNIANPVATWVTNTPGVFDISGAFSNAIPINHGTPAQFFRLKTP